jgi:hypothetical protein
MFITLKYKSLRRIILPIVFCCLNLKIKAFNFEKLTIKNVKIVSEIGPKNVEVKFIKKCLNCSDMFIEKRRLHIDREEKITVPSNDKKIQNILLLGNSDGTIFVDEQEGEVVILKIKKQIKKNDISFNERDFDFLEKESPDFFNSLQNNKISLGSYLPHGITPSFTISLFKKLYEKNSQSKTKNKKNECRIPYIIHQNWFGVTGDMPMLYRQWKKDWRKKHPGWTIICWNEEMLRQHLKKKFYNEKIFNNAKNERNYAKMSDVVRYEIIEKFGGLYVDFDTRCFESFKILHDKYDFFASLEEINGLLACANCVFGAKTGHPILKKCIENINNYKADPLNITGHSKWEIIRDTLLRTGPGIFTKSVLEAICLNNNIDIIFPHVYFCTPYTAFDSMKVEAFCVHDFLCPSVKQKTEHWINIVSKDL